MSSPSSRFERRLMEKVKTFFTTHWKKILEYVIIIILSIGFSVGAVAAIFYGYYNIGATDPTTIGVERVEFVDATDEEGNPITGFKLTDNATGVQYLVTDEWAPLQLVSDAPEAE